MDIFLTLLVIATAVVAVRLLVCAVARCLCDDDEAAAAHHHHHHHHHSPDTSDFDEDVEAWHGAGLAIFGHA
ncbi:hypothetical protein EJB05_47938, partial [Eragrostis curvula]